MYVYVRMYARYGKYLNSKISKPMQEKVMEITNPKRRGEKIIQPKSKAQFFFHIRHEAKLARNTLVR